MQIGAPSQTVGQGYYRRGCTRRNVPAYEGLQTIRKHLAEIVLLALVTGVLISARASSSAPDRQANPTGKNHSPAKADLLIRKFTFPADNDKAVRVHIANAGGSASAHCILRLTVRKIEGVPVGRVVEIKLPPLSPGENKWLGINAASILSNNISLQSTTFKLNADATSVVTESDEANNEVWHKL